MVNRLRLQFILFYFFILQALIVMIPYFQLGLGIKYFQNFSVTQTSLILLFVILSMFCLVLIGFTILAIFLETLLILVNEYSEGYQKILKVLLIISVIQIPQIYITLLLKDNITILVVHQTLLEIFFKVIEILFFSYLVILNFKKKDTVILITSFILIDLLGLILLRILFGY